jgi:hypothetical protein
MVERGHPKEGRIQTSRCGTYISQKVAGRTANLEEDVHPHGEDETSEDGTRAKSSTNWATPLLLASTIVLCGIASGQIIMIDAPRNFKSMGNLTRQFLLRIHRKRPDDRSRNLGSFPFWSDKFGQGKGAFVRDRMDSVSEHHHTTRNKEEHIARIDNQL